LFASGRVETARRAGETQGDSATGSPVKINAPTTDTHSAMRQGLSLPRLSFCPMRHRLQRIQRLQTYVPSIAIAVTLTACDNKTTGPTQPQPPPQTNVVSYTAIGASDAIGVGASHECFPFSPCPDGTGYVQVTTKRLQAAGKTVTLLNLGIPGAVLGPDI